MLKLQVCKGNLSLLKIRILNLKQHTERMATEMTTHTGSTFTALLSGVDLIVWNTSTQNPIFQAIIRTRSISQAISFFP